MLDEGYGIMPNKVLYDAALSPSAKLLFCAISSLCAQRGYCFASNAYLAGLFDVSEKQVSRNIAQLSPYLSVEHPSNQQRIIRLDKKVQPPGQKGLGRLDKKRTHINTSDNYKKKSGELTAEQEIARRYQRRPTVLPDWVDGV